MLNKVRLIARMHSEIFPVNEQQRRIVAAKNASTRLIQAPLPGPPLPAEWRNSDRNHDTDPQNVSRFRHSQDST
jgi:hypothetical protein